MVGSPVRWKPSSTCLGYFILAAKASKSSRQSAAATILQMNFSKDSKPWSPRFTPDPARQEHVNEPQGGEGGHKEKKGKQK